MISVLVAVVAVIDLYTVVEPDDSRATVVLGRLISRLTSEASGCVMVRLFCASLESLEELSVITNGLVTDVPTIG